MSENIREVQSYIKNISITPGYEDIITVEHRSNNAKRDFLFMNKLQCKHIPSNPLVMEKMCIDLANLCNKTLINESVLIIGFAETATAIARIIAENISTCSYVVCTTRENIYNSKEVIKFEEEHSHATLQKILSYDDNTFEDILNKVSYILFVDDEITTGKTILNFICEFNKKFTGNYKFGVASICNWQNYKNKSIYSEKNIDIFCLISGELENDNAKMNISDNCIITNFDIAFDKKDVYIKTYYSKISNEFEASRLGYKPNKEDKSLVNDVIATLKQRYGELFNTDIRSVRVIGSEECMYIPIKIGIELQKIGLDVICHSTTRSSIDIIRLNSDYDTPIYSRIGHIVNKVDITSAYELTRKTYLYNTEEYTDMVLVMSDTKNDICFENFIYDISRIFGRSSKIVAYRI